ncbi:MAG: radical SAM protein [Microthrixaceae bacterium]
MVVLNTCCIRENADNKLYGTLGHLKSLKDRRPGLEIVVAGCLAQKDRESISERAPHVDVVLGTHNVHRAVELLHESRAAGRPVVEILEETVAEDHELFPSALPVVREVGYTGWVTIQIGCDNSCAFCIVPAVRGPEISRPFGDIVAEVESAAADGVTEVTLLGQNVNSYGRDLALRARRSGDTTDAADLDFLIGEAAAATTADGLRPRPLFADLLRAVGAVPGIRRVRYTSPHPKDLRAGDDRGNGRRAGGVRTPAPSAAVRQRPASSPRCTADTPQSDTWRGWQQRAPASTDLAVTTDIIVGFPGETDRRLPSATLEVAAEAAFDGAFTFVYSPRPGTEAAELADRFVPREVAAARMERLRSVVERSSRLANLARVGTTEEVLVEGPSERDPSRLSGRTRQNRLVHFEPGQPIRAGSYATVEVVDATTTHLRGRLVEVLAGPTHRVRIPVSAE